MSINTQINIRNNTSDMRSYINDLYDWEESMNKKKKTKKTVNSNVPIRGNVEEEERQQKLKAEKEKKQEIFEFNSQNQDKKPLQRDSNTV